MKPAESLTEFDASSRLAGNTPAQVNHQTAALIRIFTGPAAGGMDRVRIIFAVVVPALWLITPGPFSLAQFSSCTGGTQVCAFWPGASAARHAPATILYTRGPSSRFSNARVQTHTGPEDLPPLDAASYPPPLAAVPLTISWPNSDLLALANSWQFDWRAAPQPRAPSTVS